jgi:hypothetical protein
LSENSDGSLVELSPQRNFRRCEVLSRRELSQRLLGMTAAWSLGGAHPVWGHLLKGTALISTDIDLSSTNWKPLFLKPEQCETLQSIAEALVTGATDALVTPFIDLLLSVSARDDREEFNASLSAVQAEARQRFGDTFQKLSAAHQDSLLTVISTAQESTAIRKAFEDLKEWVVGSYYSSEAGMKELGWTPNRFFSSFPGCTHPDENL